MASAMEEPKNILLQPTERNVRISQLLENPNTPKRLKMEINDLLQNKNCEIDAYSVDSKTHPFEIKIPLYDYKTEHHVLTCKISHNYPFYAPVLCIETKDEQLNAKDLIIIQKNLNNALNQTWSPSRRMNDILVMADTKIRSYKDNKIASEQVAKGYARTLIDLKEKYQSNNVTFGGKYPEFQKKLDGLWIRKMPTGYFVFHVEGDYIHIAFEPEYIGAAPLSYHGSYAAGYYETNNNRFDIHISDVTDSGTINNFQITVDSDSMSIMFRSLKNDSILDPIISQLEMNNVIGENINLIKV